MTTYNELLALLKTISPEEKAKLTKMVMSPKNKFGSSRLWVPNPGGQTLALNSLADELFFGGQPGGGKLLDVSTPLPTPTGWTTMGEVAVGDYLLDECGEPCRVVAKSNVETEKTYLMTFSDGSEITAGYRHQWVTSTRSDRISSLCRTDEWRSRRRDKRPSRAKENPQKPGVQASVTKMNMERVYEYKTPTMPSVKTTDDIFNSLLVGKENRVNHSVGLCRPINLPHAELLIDPYVLGAWLGDGTSVCGAITSVDSEIMEAVSAAGYSVSVRSKPTYHGVLGLQKQLRILGLLGNKHIPAAYLRSSIEQRVSLLQGLMDTDGYCEKRGQCEIQLTRKVLVDGVYELLCSLGIKVEVKEGVAKLYGREIGKKWRLKFLTEINAFTLPRKLIRQKKSGFRGTHALRYITSVKEVPAAKMQCVQVDSASHMYLCGKAMIPTHNSSLLIGTAICDHTDSIIFRREIPQIKGLEKEAQRILGNRDGYSTQTHEWKIPNTKKTMEFGSVPNEDDKERFQGRAHDLCGFDEICHFSRTQYQYLTMWLRSTVDGQRCRVIATGNPPQTAEGFWVIEYWGPWLDDAHADPALPGELRWPVRASETSDAEIFFHTKEDAIAHVSTFAKPPCDMDGNIIPPRSRTFIPGKLEENPDLIRTGYNAVLAYSSAKYQGLASGKFETSLEDAPNQLIPTSWIIEAQQRWTERPPKDAPMIAMAADVAQGGADNTVVAWRYDWWFAPLLVTPGINTPNPSDVVGMIVRNRRDGAVVVIDCGGGYGGGVVEGLSKHNGIQAIAHKGSAAGVGRSKCKHYRFSNKRAEVWWKFREALDPSQQGGSPIALPPDAALRADLSAPRVDTENARGVKVEGKEEIKKRIGRSPDRGDAVVMCWAEGQRGLRQAESRGKPLSSLSSNSKQSNTTPQFAKMRDGPLRRRRKG